MTIDRRKFLYTCLGLAAGAPAAASAMRVSTMWAATALSNEPPSRIRPAPDLRDGQTRLALPDGWVYRSFGATGDIMSDGVSTPGRHDGMAAFGGPGGAIRVIRNHEERESGTPLGDTTRAYDGNTRGGATTLEIDPFTRELVRAWVSLNGTSFNCAGGPTPWGTWLSAEETVNGPDVGRDFGGDGPDFRQPHGFVFEVSPAWGPGAHPRVEPIRKLGRFPHEACAIDPRTGVLYQTEDQFLFPGGVYRYRTEDNPMKARRLLDGGVLEMMRVRGSTEPAALGRVLTEGDTFDIDWVVIDEPDPNFSPSAPPTNNEAIRHVSAQGIERNAATFARPEGCWFANGALWFICTRGGSSDAALNESPEDEYGDGRGQVWRYEPAREQLTLIFQSTDPAILDMPDSMTISPTGTVLMGEDGKDGNFVRALGSNGTLSDIAQNISKHPDKEFSGICFSPDGRTLFVNLQGIEGTTLAIWRQDNRPLT